MLKNIDLFLYIFRLLNKLIKFIQQPNCIIFIFNYFNVEKSIFPFPSNLNCDILSEIAMF